MTEPDSTQNIGKAFTWIAWIMALALMVWGFQNLLDEQWQPNANPDTYLTADGKAEVHLKQNRQGHYIVDGYINDIPVTFLLDTGATNVSIPAHIAEDLQLEARGSYYANTANGQVKVYGTTIEQLNIGNIFLYNISASINPGMKSNEILLGMSALKKIEFNQTGKQLILREQS